MVNTQNCGIILHRLSKTLLSPLRRTSAPKQLADVCGLVSGKTAKLDFPGVLALLATRIRTVYLEFGQEHLRNLVEELDWSCMVQVLEVLSYARPKWLALNRLFRTSVIACFVDAPPDAVMHLRPEWHAFTQDDQTVLLTTPHDRSRWNNRQLYYFSVDRDATHDLLWHSMDPRLSFNEKTRRLGVGNGSSVLIPKNLIRQTLQKDLESGYDLLDGCCDLGGRPHSSLIDADLREAGANFAFGKGPLASIIAPSNIGCNKQLKIGAQECHKGIMLSAMLHPSNSLLEIVLRPRLNPAR